MRFRLARLASVAVCDTTAAVCVMPAATCALSLPACAREIAFAGRFSSAARRADAWGAAAEPPPLRTGCRIPPNVRAPHPAPAYLRAGSSCRAFSTCFAAAANDRVKITSCCCAAALLAQTAHAGARIIRGARRPSGRRGIMRHAAPRTKEAPCQREPTRSPLRSTT